MIRKAIIVVLTLAALGTAAAWVVSYIVWDTDVDQVAVAYSYGVGYWFAEPTDPSAAGWLLVDVSRGTFDLNRWNYKASRPPPSSRRWRRLGFSFNAGACRGRQPPYSFWLLEIPLWALFLLFAVYPAIAFVHGPLWRRLRRRRRRKRGLCIACGYDLTGNVTGVCSECGEDTPGSMRAPLDTSSGFAPTGDDRDGQNVES